jgi:prephenate dehydratase
MPSKIAYQGEPGANSHIACIEAYPNHEPLPCGTFEDAFQAVTDGEAALAMIPIDNSVAGRVADIHHLLPRSNLYIIGEHFLPVHHQLMIAPEADDYVPPTPIDEWVWPYPDDQK